MSIRPSLPRAVPIKAFNIRVHVGEFVEGRRDGLFSGGDGCSFSLASRPNYLCRQSLGGIVAGVPGVC